MVTKAIFRGSLRQSIVEVILIIIGVLSALWVDEWRSDLAEKKAVQRHLVAIVEEIDSNRWSLHRVRDFGVPRTIEALEAVIRTLDRPDPEIEDPEQFIAILITSARDRSPWFERNSFDSFRTSEQYHSSNIQGFTTEVSDAYESQNILYRDRFDHENDYKDAISQLVPARFQSDYNELRSYAPPRFSAPPIADQKPVNQVVLELIENRKELVRLARYKGERITAQWYAMTRILLDFQDVRDKITSHPLMKGVDLPMSERHEELEKARI